VRTCCKGFNGARAESAWRLRRGPEEADAENVRVAVLLDELDFPGARMQLKSIFFVLLLLTSVHPGLSW
jgi:hypothetical protein